MTERSKLDPKLHSALPAPLIGLIAVATTPEPDTLPIAHAAHLATVKNVVLARIRNGQTSPLEQTLRDEAWHAVHTKIHVKVLRNDGATLSWLLRLLPDTGLPPHPHDDGDEECLVVEGAVQLDGVVFSAGDYTVAPRGSIHKQVYSAQGCVLFLKSPASQARHLGALVPA